MFPQEQALSFEVCESDSTPSQTWNGLEECDFQQTRTWWHHTHLDTKRTPTAHLNILREVLFVAQQVFLKDKACESGTDCDFHLILNNNIKKCIIWFYHVRNVMHSNKTGNKSHRPILKWAIEVGIGVKNNSSVNFEIFAFYIP